MTETSTTHPVPASHHAIALHAVTCHMLDHDLPVPAQLAPQSRHIELLLHGAGAWDAWTQSLGHPEVETSDDRRAEHGYVKDTCTAPLPDLGVVVRLVFFRFVGVTLEVVR